MTRAGSSTAVLLTGCPGRMHKALAHADAVDRDLESALRRLMLVRCHSTVELLSSLR